MQAVLILEDNNDKIANIFMKYGELLRYQTVFIARTVETAKAFVESDPGLMTIFVDYELDPGCGDGLQFMNWLMLNAAHFVERVVITTFSLTVGKEIARLCREKGIEAEKL